MVSQCGGVASADDAGTTHDNGGASLGSTHLSSSSGYDDTQTSSVAVTSTSEPLPKDIANAENEVPVNVRPCVDVEFLDSLRGDPELYKYDVVVNLDITKSISVWQWFR